MTHYSSLTYLVFAANPLCLNNIYLINNIIIQKIWWDDSSMLRSACQKIWTQNVPNLLSNIGEKIHRYKSQPVGLNDHFLSSDSS